MKTICLLMAGLVVSLSALARPYPLYIAHPSPVFTSRCTTWQNLEDRPDVFQSTMCAGSIYLYVKI
jgi:hypothetical protein